MRGVVAGAAECIDIGVNQIACHDRQYITLPGADHSVVATLSQP